MSQYLCSIITDTCCGIVRHWGCSPWNARTKKSSTSILSFTLKITLVHLFDVIPQETRACPPWLLLIRGSLDMPQERLGFRQLQYVLKGTKLSEKKREKREWGAARKKTQTKMGICCNGEKSWQCQGKTLAGWWKDWRVLSASAMGNANKS